MSSPFYPVPPQASNQLAVGEPAPTMGAEWEERRQLIGKNRAYYDGTQFDEVNRVRAQELGCGDKPLPEWERLHAYSGQIGECVDFIADQLTDGFGVICTNSLVQQIVDAALDATDLFRNDSDEDIALDDLIVEAGQAGDVVYETRWNAVEGGGFWEFWAAEDVEFEVPYGRHISKVTRRMRKTVPRLVGSEFRDVEVTEICTYELKHRLQNEDDLFDASGAPVPGVEPVLTIECFRRTWWDNEEQLSEWMGMPFIPWGIVRADRRGLRGFRGQPLITRRAIDNADRYNANEQTAYQIARFNSHGSLVVIGDQAYLKIQSDGGVNRDVMDVLTYPEGTKAFAVTLPTDPEMIDHTRQVTADAIYGSFGLTRVEPDTLQGLDAPSGYALEILNRKSEGKLKRVRRVLKTDLVGMINQLVDLTAIRQGVLAEDTGLLEVGDREDLPEVVADNWWEVDPAAVFPDREIEIRMGAGYIVDDVMIRDDFTSGLISQEEGLRRRGYSDEDIEQIMAEQQEAADAAAERFQAQPVASQRGAGTIVNDADAEDQP